MSSHYQLEFKPLWSRQEHVKTWHLHTNAHYCELSLFFCSTHKSCLLLSSHMTIIPFVHNIPPKSKFLPWVLSKHFVNKNSVLHVSHSGANSNDNYFHIIDLKKKFI